MIRFLLLQNRQGKTRLSKWWIPLHDEKEKLYFVEDIDVPFSGPKVRIENEVHRLVVTRDRKYTNFVEYGTYKLIYRRYAGLFFTFGMDVNDNELLALETVHLFVELLESYFSNVCELDIVFNFNKVYNILDEFILSGEVEESSKREILERIRELEKLD